MTPARPGDKFARKEHDLFHIHFRSYPERRSMADCGDWCWCCCCLSACADGDTDRAPPLVDAPLNAPLNTRSDENTTDRDPFVRDATFRSLNMKR
jgi:hypothetical protein